MFFILKTAIFIIKDRGFYIVLVQNTTFISKTITTTTTTTTTTATTTTTTDNLREFALDATVILAQPRVPRLRADAVYVD